MKKIQIYTDGAARGNPGPAGWGAVLFMDGKVVELGGRMDHATNNIMELSAPIGALAYLKQQNITGEVEIISDSKYVILGITEWIHGWLRNNWRNAAKKPVMNRELWEELHKLNEEFKPKWTYIEGHAGHEHNERADVIATSYADKEPIELRK
jgi:ribonuclease HI